MAAGSKRLGKAIYDHRLVVLGQTREQVGATLGTSKTTVGRWEDAVVLPEPKMVPALSAWLGVTAREMGALLRDELLDEDPATRQRLSFLEGEVEALREDLRRLGEVLARRGAENGLQAVRPQGLPPAPATPPAP